MNTQVTAASSTGVYVTSYCNHAHRLSDGKPLNHECYVLPPHALQLEREGKFDEAIGELTRAKPLRMSRGVRACTSQNEAD